MFQAPFTVSINSTALKENVSKPFCKFIFFYMQPNKEKLEFFTLDCRITIQRSNIYHKKVKDGTQTIHYRSLILIGFALVVYLTILEIKEDGNYFSLLRILVLAFLLAPEFKSIYKTLFVKTWKSIIPLKDVKAITTKPLDNGLETEVTLHLQNGRKKFYTFRNAEGQMKAFIDAVEAPITATAPVAL
jgi:hypothetical protein